MLPIWAAKAAPVRPAMIIPVMIAPISRAIATATKLATKMPAPNWLELNNMGLVFDNIGCEHCRTLTDFYA